MTLTTHVIDTAAGVPAAGIAIVLYAVDGATGTPLASATGTPLGSATRTRLGGATTNAGGRTDAPLAESLGPGWYELTFAVAPYFAAQNVAAFYDEITIRFRLEGGAHYHVPLLLGPWGYSTYRGS
jgi:5-hydroxyisourate hydrolase